MQNYKYFLKIIIINRIILNIHLQISISRRRVTIILVLPKSCFGVGFARVEVSLFLKPLCYDASKKTKPSARYVGRPLL